jgi:short subunit dehydrogenase-like uncharacterized protein
MAGRIVLFGATGFAGDLTARALVGRGARPVLAARGKDRVRALAQELGGLEWAVADVGRPESVRALVERGDVLVSTVGPFAKWGSAAVQAAIGAGANYLDSTGESPFIREVFERYGSGAQAAGCGLVTAFGYDWVPGNLVGALALREAGEAATRVDIGYFTPGAGTGTSSLSGGTLASAAGIALEPGFAWHGGRLVHERPARRVRSFELTPGRRARAITVPSSEAFGLPQAHPTLRDVNVFLGWFGALSDPLRVVWAALSPAAERPRPKAVLEDVFGRLFKGSSGGPDAATRAKSRSVVIAEAFDASGTRLASVRLEGKNIYDLTAGLLAWGAETAATGGLRGTGAMGPVDGFGLEPLQAGAEEAGLARVESHRPEGHRPSSKGRK